MERNLHTFICECGSLEHQAIFYFDEDPDGFDDLYVYIHLTNYKSFWKRLLAAIRYIFGHRSKYGEFDQFLLDPEDCDRLIEVITRFKKRHNEKKNERSLVTS